MNDQLSAETSGPNGPHDDVPDRWLQAAFGRLRAPGKAPGAKGVPPEDSRDTDAQFVDAVEDTALHGVRESSGARVGRYKLLEKLGEGGFGVVYAAEQLEPVKRKVALKIIKLGMDTRQVIARFEAERQALAMMDHANIARALDAGATESGRPYFVMELVHGVSITEFCDQQSLDTVSRLDLFTKVCHAIQHAHQKGIIHRDIKPSNVLISLHDGVPVPKVIDFGIAKATKAELTEKTLYTLHRQVIGTPEYMSPEQAELSGLDIDTRTDIYSLGVLLYELLTGTTPFPGEMLRKAGLAEVHRIICDREPEKPSTRVSALSSEPLVRAGDSSAIRIATLRRTDPESLCKLLRGDLDWVIMKCLAKDRTQRYETANSLAQDIGRHLNHEPVQACPPSAAYRLRKFARRNRATLITVSGIISSLIVGLALAAIGLVQANQERAFTKAALEEVKTERQRAEANLSLALEVLDEIYLDEAEHLPGKAEPINENDRELLQAGLRFYESFAEKNSSAPQARRQAARAYQRAGLIHHRLGEYELAAQTLRHGLDLFQALSVQFPDSRSISTTRCWSITTSG